MDHVQPDEWDALRHERRLRKRMRAVQDDHNDGAKDQQH
jgi:hypothetical protein